MKRIFKNFTNLHLAKFVITAIVLLAGCTKETGEPEQVSISYLKSLRKEMVEKTVLEKEYIVKGFFVNGTVPLLITDMKLILINTPMPDSAYILLKGKGIDALTKEKDVYGTFIELKGKINFEQFRDKEGYEIEIICPEMPKVLEKSKFVKPIAYNICQIYPKICELGKFFPTKFAFLYSGGYNSSNAHIRYWNDLKFMYLTLRNKYGYSDANILVVYKDGSGEDADMTVDYAASPSGLNDAINYLRDKMKLKDELFIFVTNHGGGYHQGLSTNKGGRLDGVPGDEIDAQKYDETIYYYNQSPNDIWDDDFSNWINSLNFSKLTAVFEPCFSGGFLHDLKGCNRVLISAASEFEYSWAMPPSYTYDEFSYHFTCALNKADDTGSALSTNPDTNGDGSVSILEAFLYAKSKDTASETPYLEDNGDGVGTNSPTATGVDGKVANIRKL